MIIGNESPRYVPTREISIPAHKLVYRIRQISDTHQDAEGFRADLFKRFVDIQSKDKDSVWIHTGDLPDSDRPSTRHMKKIMYSDRHEAFTQEDRRNLDWLDRSIIPQYKKIAPSCLGILDGDHYLAFANGMTSGRYLAYKLKVPYLGERSSYVRLVFKSGTHSFNYIIHARHGKSGGGSIGGSANALVKGDAAYLADLHLGGHNHMEHCHPQRLEYVDRLGHQRNKIIWYIRGGSMLDGFPVNGRKTYAYRKEYNPLPCGWGEVELEITKPYHNDTKQHAQSQVTMSKGSVIAG